MKQPKIPEATIHRLSTYGRVLSRLEEEGIAIISSGDLAERCGLNPAQIRKDLAYFGEFGVRGVGYHVQELRENLKGILGVTHVWRVALVGAGNLGSALAAYKGFLTHGFVIEVLFDKYPSRSKLPRGGRLPKVLALDRIKQEIRRRGIHIGIIAVPAEAAQDVADRLVAAGVFGILNFAPVRLVVPKHIKVKYVDLGSELASLSFFLSKRSDLKVDSRRRGW